MKTYKKPYLVHNTLFIDSHTPEKAWKLVLHKKIQEKGLDKGCFQVYVPLDVSHPQASIDFADRVLSEIRHHYLMVDPVVVGSIKGEHGAKLESKIDEKGLLPTELDEEQYIKKLEEAAQSDSKQVGKNTKELIARRGYSAVESAKEKTGAENRGRSL